MYEGETMIMCTANTTDELLCMNNYGMTLHLVWTDTNLAALYPNCAIS